MIDQDSIDNFTNITVSIAVYKDGVFVDSFTVDYLAVMKANRYAKIFSVSELDEGNYHLVYCITGDNKLNSDDETLIVAQVVA